jgi:hypothetical protein
MSAVSPSIIPAVYAMRSYQNALLATSINVESLNQWISRHANTNVVRNEEFPPDAAVAVLSYFNHPLYTHSNLTQVQQNWATHMQQAEQILQQEKNWTSTQISQNALTMFNRVFSSDRAWLRDWAIAALPYPVTAGDEYIINELIAAFIQCRGSTSHAGQINHTSHSIAQPVP